MNEMLGAGANYSRGIAVQFGTEEQEGVPTLAPELVPTSDIHARPEQWALHGGTLLQGSAGVVGPGGAGNRSQVAIEPGPGELVIVEDVWLWTTVGAQYIHLGLSQTPLANPTGTLLARDARRIITAGGSGASGTRIRTQSNTPLANLAGILGSWQIGNTFPPIRVPLEIVLVAPWSLRLFPAADDSAIQSLEWRVRVRPATPRELAAGPTGAL